MLNQKVGRATGKLILTLTLQILPPGSVLVYAGECDFTIGRARPILSNPAIISSTNFRVHYTLSGQDASSQQRAQAVAEYAEASLSIFESLGWALPPHDYGSGGGIGINPDQKYDIFIYNTFGLFGLFGFAEDEGAYFDSAAPPNYPDGRTSWMGIENDTLNYTPQISQTDRLKALVAHELHHACQLRYASYNTIPSPTWFMENTSVYMEDVVYDSVNTLYHRLLQSAANPLTDPDYPINFYHPVNSYQYQGAVWPTFLHEFYGDFIVRKCWEIMGSVSGENTLSAIDSALRAYSSSDLSIALKYYGVWRYFTGSRADAFHFSEGSTWPTSPILHTHNSYPVTDDQDFEHPLSPGGTNYIIFNNLPLSLPLTFDGQDSYSWGAMVVGDRGTTTFSYDAEIALNSSRFGSNKILTKGLSKLVLMSVMTQWSGQVSTPTYSYTASAIPTNETVMDSITTGWNLLSVPNHVTNFLKTSIFPAATSNAWTGVPYAAQDTLKNGPSYWVKFSSTFNKSYIGAPFDLMWFPVNSGWNMVGSMATTIDTTRIFPSKGISRQSRYQAYNGSYSAASALQPGNGYWVKLSGTGYLTYNGTATTSAPPPSSNDPNPPIAPGQITAPALNGSISSGHPYLSWNPVSGGVEYRIYRYECEGASDCDLTGSLRYSGPGTSFIDIQIQIGNKLDPTTVWYYLRAADVFGEVSVKSNKKSFWKDEGFQERADAGGVIEEDKATIPTSYYLHANYPNPFNPTTTIDYELPEDALVNLEVFNTLGQRVASLVNAIQGAGYKFVSFDANELPAGVYIYRIRMGTFSAMRKMILIK